MLPARYGEQPHRSCSVCVIGKYIRMVSQVKEKFGNDGLKAIQEREVVRLTEKYKILLLQDQGINQAIQQRLSELEILSNEDKSVVQFDSPFRGESIRLIEVHDRWYIQPSTDPEDVGHTLAAATMVTHFVPIMSKQADAILAALRESQSLEEFKKQLGRIAPTTSKRCCTSGRMVTHSWS